MRAPPDAQKRTPPSEMSGAAKTKVTEDQHHTPKQPTLQAFVHVHKTEPGRQHCYLYSMEFNGEIVVDHSVDAATSLARALLAKGLTGHCKVIHKESGQHRYTINIKNTAKIMTCENASRGPCFVKFKSDRFPTDAVLSRSGGSASGESPQPESIDGPQRGVSS